MKKYLLLAFITICTWIIIPSKAYSVELSIGPSIWYATWLHNGWYINDGSSSHRFYGEDNGQTLLYGPALSVKLNDYYNITFVYLFGRFSVTDTEDWYNQREYEYKSKVNRNDADLAINGRFGDNFKLYCGIKYMSLSTGAYEHYGVGPGLGLVVTLPVPMTENLFILFNVGGFYLYSKESSDYTDKTDCNDFGANATLSLAYYINPISINLGYRFQYIKTKYDEKARGYNYNYESTIANTFYGITLTATYAFSI
ncbi:MAG: hypothetical protein FWH53_05100 [Leptospirales bacterium]|nr:hypothetical protein [Leptospirales bacterium]